MPNFWNVAQLLTVYEVYAELQPVVQVRRLFLLSGALWRQTKGQLPENDPHRELLRTLEELLQGRARLRDLMEFWTRANVEALDRWDLQYTRRPVEVEWEEGDIHPRARSL